MGLTLTLHKLLVILAFLSTIVLSIITFLILTKHGKRHTFSSSFSHQHEKSLLYDGSITLAGVHVQFLNRALGLVLNTFTLRTRCQAITGYSCFLTKILTLLCLQQLDWTQNKPWPSMSQLSTASLMSSPNLLRSMIFLQKMSTIWMKKDVNGMVERKAASINMSIPENSWQGTNIAVLILNLLQSLRLSVLMEKPSNLVLSSLVHHSALNGLIMIQKSCKKLFKICVPWLIFWCQCCNFFKWMDRWCNWCRMAGKSFIPQAKHCNKSGKPILPILDGHSSHETLQFIDLAEKNNIIVLCLPPHTTHKPQPLDVGVFGLFQWAWLDLCDSVVELTGSEMPKENFIKQYMKVRSSTFKSITIISAFKKSGIWPVNQAVFTGEDYAPSLPYSTETCNFPTVPSPDNSSDSNDSDVGSDSDSDSDGYPELKSHYETRSHTTVTTHQPPLPPHINHSPQMQLPFTTTTTCSTITPCATTSRSTTFRSTTSHSTTSCSTTSCSTITLMSSPPWIVVLWSNALWMHPISWRQGGMTYCTCEALWFWNTGFETST